MNRQGTNKRTPACLPRLEKRGQASPEAKAWSLAHMKRVAKDLGL